MKKIYKIILVAILQSSIFNLPSFSQTAPGIEWQNTIGGSNEDQLYSIQQTDDGGYILCGTSLSDISGDKTESSNGWYDYWIVKTDLTGIIQWQNTIGGSGTEELRSLQQTADGGYILGGHSSSDISGDKTENSNGGHDYWIVKTDSTGNIQWQNTIGGNDIDLLYSVQQTVDGGYILGGWSTSNISGDKTENNIGGMNATNDYWIVKTDTAGIIQWQNTIGGTYGDALQSIQQTADGGYILGGTSQSNISGDKTENTIGGTGYHDYWIVKTDSTGNIQWENTIGGNDYDILYSIQQCADGGYILGGYSNSNISGDKTENNWDPTLITSDYWIVKTDSTGNIQWQNTIGGSDDDLLYSIQQTADGGYILCGYSLSGISGDKTEISNGSWDYWIVKTNSTGNIQWQKTIGGSDDDELRSIRQSTDGGYILGGSSVSNISGDKTETCIGNYDYWIVKLTPDTIISLVQLPNFHSPLKIYPNPFSNKLNFTMDNYEPSEIILYDISSRKILQDKFTFSVSLNTEHLTKGMYIYEVRDKNGLSKKGKVVND